MNPLPKQIRNLAQSLTAPNGKKYQSLSLEAVRKISKKSRLLGKEVEIAALKIRIIPERYQRNIGTIGTKGQIKLLKSKVVVVGCGGLGGTVAEIFARMGVGHLIVVDGDSFEESNINRHLHCHEENIGKNKAEELEKRVKQVNSGIRVIPITSHLTDENAGDLVKGSDVVVDALGEIDARFILETAAKKEGIPLVHGAIAGFYGQVTTIFPEDEGLRRIYGSREKAPKVGSESELGTPGPIVGIVASFQAQEVIKFLVGSDKLFRNKLLTIDCESGNIEIINLSP